MQLWCFKSFPHSRPIGGIILSYYFMWKETQQVLHVDLWNVCLCYSLPGYSPLSALLQKYKKIEEGKLILKMIAARSVSTTEFHKSWVALKEFSITVWPTQKHDSYGGQLSSELFTYTVGLYSWRVIYHCRSSAMICLQTTSAQLTIYREPCVRICSQTYTIQFRPLG